MLCKLCSEQLDNEGRATPHQALAQAGRARKLRPFLRKPVCILRYRCAKCGTHWLLERDPLAPVQDDWTCLGKALSILEPLCLQLNL